MYTTMDSQHKKNPNNQSNDESTTHDKVDDDGTLNHPQNWPKYWIMEGTDGSNPLSKMNPFLVSKAIQGISATLKVKRLRNGSLLIECDHKTQARSLRKITQLGSVPVRVSPHRTMNSCQGIIHCRDISDMSDDEIQQELSPQGVTKVKQFTVKRNDQIKKTGTFCLTFNSASLPQSINAGYLRIKVEAYVPNPLRCFKCQKFGHGQNACNGHKTCMKCGKDDHGDEPCMGPLHCVNCAGPHPANSKQCPSWVKECAIQKLKTQQKLPYGEAKRLFEASNPPPPSGGSYAKVAAEKVSVAAQTLKVSVGTQTDKTCTPNSKEEATTAEAKPNRTGEKSNKNVPPAASRAPHSESPASPGKKPPKDAASKPAASPKAAKTSGAVSPLEKANETEKPKVRLNRNNGSRPQKGSNDPVKDGVDAYEEELDLVPSNKKGRGKANGKNKLSQ